MTRRALFAGVLGLKAEARGRVEDAVPTDMNTVNAYVAVQNTFSDRMQWFIRSLDLQQVDWAQWKRVLEARRAVQVAWDRLR